MVKNMYHVTVQTKKKVNLSWLHQMKHHKYCRANDLISDEFNELTDDLISDECNKVSNDLIIDKFNELTKPCSLVIV